MATGKIKDIDNDGSEDGVGGLIDDSTGKYYVFFTPDDTRDAAPLAVGTAVSYTQNGEVANGLKKV